jgi:RNA polymerase sigma factor (sigma-70 family)
MTNEVTSSIEMECSRRLEVLYKNSHEWLLKVSYNICKSRLESQDMVGELYVYLAEKCNPKLYYEDSYNLIYCMRFLSSRWINKVKRNKKMQYVPTIQSEAVNEEYDITLDNDIMIAHEEVIKEIQRLKKTRQFSSARIYELYWIDNDDTLQELADKIGISKSTVFIHLKRVRQHLKNVINNPFN